MILLEYNLLQNITKLIFEYTIETKYQKNLSFTTENNDHVSYFCI